MEKEQSIRKVDLVMWAKNGAKTLPTVLKRIDEVIPNEKIDNKILIDDHSTDGTNIIAKDFGWIVLTNTKGGVGAGANLALHQIRNDYFISFEQDVVLAKNWWERIPKHFVDRSIAVAQGWRYSSHKVIGKMDQYITERFKNSLYSIDNTIYRTEVIKDLGGFPEHLKYTGVDLYAYLKVLNAGFKWITDTSVLSIHLRAGGLKEQMARYYHYGMDMPTLKREKIFEGSKMVSGIRRSVLIALFSPIRGLQISVKKKCPQAIYYYPLMRLSHLCGYLRNELSHSK